MWTEKKRSEAIDNGFPEIDSVKVGQNIRNAIDESGYSVSDVAGMLFMSNQALYQCIKGDNLPSLPTIYAMSCILGVTIDNLVCQDILEKETELEDCSMTNSSKTQQKIMDNDPWLDR